MKFNGPIVIIGFMGCGKSEVARALARRLDLPVVDLDAAIAEQQGRTAAQLICEDGEPAFRAIETKALGELLESGVQGVVALGGGAWLTEANRKLIDQYRGVTVWIDAPFDLCWQRIKRSGEDRPLGRTREEAEQLYRVRQPVYEQAAIRVPVEAHESVDTVVAHVEAELANRAAGRPASSRVRHPM